MTSTSGSGTADGADGDPDSAHHASRAFAALRRTPHHAAMLLDADLTVRWASESIVTVLGTAPGNLVGTSALHLVHPDDLGDVAEAVGVVLDPELSRGAIDVDGVLPMSLRLRHAHRGWTAVDVTGFNFLPDRDVDGLLVLIQRRTDPEALSRVIELIAVDADEQRSLGAVVDLVESRIGRGRAMVVATDGDVVSHPALPFAAADAIAAMATTVDGPSTIEITDPTLTAALGGAVAAWVVPIVDPSGRRLGSIVVARSAPRPLSPSPRQVLELAARLASLVLVERTIKRQLAHDASHDPLTGLLNRVGFAAALERLGKNRHLVVMYVDLDDFKPVNDALGHAAGDMTLRVVGRRLAGIVRPTDIAARLGGDEFAIVCTGKMSPADVSALASRVIGAVAMPIEATDGELVSISASVGVAAGRETSQLLRHADAALYDAKASGKGRVAYCGIDGQASSNVSSR